MAWPCFPGTFMTEPQSLCLLAEELVVLRESFQQHAVGIMKSLYLTFVLLVTTPALFLIGQYPS